MNLLLLVITDIPGWDGHWAGPQAAVCDLVVARRWKSRTSCSERSRLQAHPPPILLGNMRCQGGSGQNWWPRWPERMTQRGGLSRDPVMHTSCNSWHLGSHEGCLWHSEMPISLQGYWGGHCVVQQRRAHHSVKWHSFSDCIKVEPRCKTSASPRIRLQS